MNEFYNYAIQLTIVYLCYKNELIFLMIYWFNVLNPIMQPQCIFSDAPVNVKPNI